jgi:hypothetical protein
MNVKKEFPENEKSRNFFNWVLECNNRVGVAILAGHVRGESTQFVHRGLNRHSYFSIRDPEQNADAQNLEFWRLSHLNWGILVAFNV